jgi:hypothetical protein
MARWHTTEFDMLPELAFQPRGSVGKFAAGMTLEGGGGGKTPKPDANIGIAQRELAKLSKQQWEFFTKDIYPQLMEETAKQEARADQQFAMTKEISDFQLGQARDAYRRYEEGAIPAMERLREDANLYDTATEQERLGAQAIGDFKSQAEQMRAQETMRQRSYGIDPTSGAALAGQIEHLRLAHAPAEHLAPLGHGGARLGLCHANAPERRIDKERIAGNAVRDAAWIVVEQIGDHDFVVVP